MNNVQALIAARNQFALRSLTQESLRLILPSYQEAMQGILEKLRSLPEGRIEREFWLKQQLANIRGQFKALGKRVEEVVPAADLRAWEIGLQNADAMLKGSGVNSPLDAVIDSGQSERFIKESNPLGEFIRPQITPQQVVAAVKKEGFSKLLAGHTKSYTLENALPAMLKSQANIIEKKLRTGFLLGQTNDEIVRNILTDRRGRAQVEAVVRTSMMEASQAAHDAFYQANDNFSWTDDSGKRHEVKLIKGYEWDSSLDDRVCPICAPLDGITRDRREDMPAQPAHFNCRCQILPMTGTTKALRAQGVLQKRTVGEQLQGMTDEQKRGVLGNQKMVDEWNKKITQAKYQKDPQRLVRDLLRPGMAAEVKAKPPKIVKPPKRKMVKKAAPKQASGVRDRDYIEKHQFDNGKNKLSHKAIADSLELAAQEDGLTGQHMRQMMEFQRKKEIQTVWSTGREKLIGTKDFDHWGDTEIIAALRKGSGKGKEVVMAIADDLAKGKKHPFMNTISKVSSGAAGHTIEASHLIVLKQETQFKPITKASLERIRNAARRSVQASVDGKPLKLVNADLYRKTGKTTWKTDDGWLVTYVHEMGHQVHFRAGQPSIRKYISEGLQGSDLQKSLELNKRNWKPSQYGQTNGMEQFAETFAQYVFAPDDLKKASPAAYKWVEETLKEALR